MRISKPKRAILARIPHGGLKRNRGVAELVAAQYGRPDAQVVADEIGCSKGYVQRIWQGIHNAER